VLACSGVIYIHTTSSNYYFLADDALDRKLSTSVQLAVHSVPTTLSSLAISRPGYSVAAGVT